MRTKLIPLAVALTGSLALALPVRAQEIKAGDLVISQAWSRATPGGVAVPVR